MRRVFCITAGRTGSHYLAALFGAVRGAVSAHEDQPIGIGAPMEQWNDGVEEPMRAIAALKARRITARAGRRPYLEANHTFIKGQGWHLAEHFPHHEMAVILLRRDADKVAQSLLRTRTVPGKTPWARMWYLRPGQRKNLAEPGAGASDLELCHWYVDEIERRTHAFATRFPDITRVEVAIEELNDAGFVHDLFERRLGLPVDTRELGRRIGHGKDPAHAAFAPVPDLTDLPALRDPDALPPDAQENLRRDILSCLETMIRDEPAKPRLSFIGGWHHTLMPAIIHALTSKERELAKRFGVALPQTAFEMDFMFWALMRLRPRDPVALLYGRDEHGHYAPLTANATPWASLRLLLRNALFRRG